jgi:serine/threonine-protein kinase RsbT
MTFTDRSQSIRSEFDITVGLSKLRTDMMAIGLSNYEVTRVATAASELAHNILKYAGSGYLRYSEQIDGTREGVEVIAHDNGPGIDDLEMALTDNYSSSGTLGLGLPGVRRLVDEFDVNSEVGAGTTVKIKIWKS